MADAKTGLQNVKEGKDAGYLVTENSATGTHYDPNFPDDVYPTQEELDTLPRHPDSLPLDVFLVRSVLCRRDCAQSTRLTQSRLMHTDCPC